MKKPVSIFKVNVEPVSKENHYHLKIKAGSGEIDAVMERSDIRHILSIIDKGIGTGL